MKLPVVPAAVCSSARSPLSCRRPLTGAQPPAAAPRGAHPGARAGAAEAGRAWGKGEHEMGLFFLGFAYIWYKELD